MELKMATKKKTVTKKKTAKKATKKKTVKKILDVFSNGILQQQATETTTP